MRITDKGKLASVKGFANESRLLAALLERGYNASLVDLPHSTYDIVVEQEKDQVIRLQVKTISVAGSVSFKGGVRGGKDREYKSGVKEYTQNTKTSDAVVGVQTIINNGDSSVDFYFIPTLYIESIKQSSITINKIANTKNNWALMEKCKDKEYVKEHFNITTSNFFLGLFHWLFLFFLFIHSFRS